MVKIMVKKNNSPKMVCKTYCTNIVNKDPGRAKHNSQGTTGRIFSIHIGAIFRALYMSGELLGIGTEINEGAKGL